MTKSEAELIELMLDIKHLLDENVVPAMRSVIEAVRAERSRHPYGSIAESMLVNPRKPEPYGHDPLKLVQWRVDLPFINANNRDVCDPPPPADPPYR